MGDFIAALGMINVDILYGGMPRIPEPGEEVFSQSFDVQLGGGAPATMVNLGRLGVPARLGTYLGQGLFSRFAEGELDRSGVTYRNLWEGDPSVEPLTVTSIISLASDRSFVSYCPPADAMRLSESAVYELYRGAKIAYITLGYDDVWRRLKREGAVLVLDTGWRDDLGMDLFREAFAYIDYFTPNDKEAMRITGAATPMEALKLLGDCLRTPLIKVGGDGCILSEGGITYSVPSLAHRFAFQDSTGAGDAFLAGFLFGLYEGRSAVESAMLGNITGGKSVTEVGCLKAWVGREELMELFQEEKGRVTRI